MPARIEDVAQKAGVSMKTVSRVFNNEPNVRERMRLRVEAAAKALNYRPNPSARSLAGNRARLDSTALNACLNALEAPENTCATSAATIPWSTPCSKAAFVGTVAKGGACFRNYECSLDDYCAPNDTCTALPTDDSARSLLPSSSRPSNNG